MSVIEKRIDFKAWRNRVLLAGLFLSFFLIGAVHSLGVHFRWFK